MLYLIEAIFYFGEESTFTSFLVKFTKPRAVVKKDKKKRS